MLQSPTLIATAAPPDAEESIPQVLCGVPDQPDKLQERRRQSASITGDRVCVDGAVGVIVTFCSVLTGLK